MPRIVFLVWSYQHSARVQTRALSRNRTRKQVAQAGTNIVLIRLVSCSRFAQKFGSSRANTKTGTRVIGVDGFEIGQELQLLECLNQHSSTLYSCWQCYFYTCRLLWTVVFCKHGTAADWSSIWCCSTHLRCRCSHHLCVGCLRHVSSRHNTWHDMKKTGLSPEAIK